MEKISVLGLLKPMVGKQEIGHSLEIQSKQTDKDQLLQSNCGDSTSLWMCHLDYDKVSEKKLDGTYIRLLRAALNVRWQSHATNKVLYENLPKISTVAKERRLRFSGHCWRNKDEIIEQLLLWQPAPGNRPSGRPDNICLPTSE